MLAPLSKILARLTPLLLLAGLLCSCATSEPKEWSVKMNPGAGVGELLVVPVTLPDGIARPFALDTGCSKTVIDKSLAPIFGAAVKSDYVWHFGESLPFQTYRATNLLIGRHLLRSSNEYVGGVDIQKILPQRMRSILGIVGMDYLGSHCLKLDFKSKRIEFLNPLKPGSTSPGKAIPMHDLGDGCCVIDQNFTGVLKSPSLLDSGYDYDGWLLPENFTRWTNTAILKTNEARRPMGILSGEQYPHVALEGISHEAAVSGDDHLVYNGIGLAFLARHTVWMDFPNHTFYLKRNTKESPLFSARQQIARRMAYESMTALVNLHKAGRLPDWSAKDKPVENNFNFDVSFPNRVSLTGVRKRGSAVTYDYVLTRENGTEWKLKEAGRTDAQGHRTALAVPN